MPNNSNPFDNETRKEAAFERLGTRKPKCSVPGCSERDWRALTDTYPNIVCYEHSKAQQGHIAVEHHHPVGRKINKELEVPMTANDHRIMDSYKNNWPKGTRENPEGSPFLRAAAYVRTAIDWLAIIIERFLPWVVEWLEVNDKHLSELHGPHWWEKVGLLEVIESRGVEL